ncbi:MAG: tyrosine-type recombinase/integrase, partial [Pseudomonadota bacterium]
AGTMKQYDGIRPRLLKGFHELAVHEITTRDITQFLDQYEATQNIANRMLSVLRAVFERGCRVGACDSNPAVGIKRFKEGKKDRYITDHEFSLIRQQANPHTQLIMDMCYLTAQRIGDVLTVRRSDITSEGITFHQQKSGARLMVEMSESLEATIEMAKALRKVPCAYLFHPKGKGTPYSYGVIKDNFYRARDNAKVAHCTLHDIRAKALTDVKKAGGDPQALAGHTLESTTVRYIRALEMPTVQGPSLDNLASLRHKP